MGLSIIFKKYKNGLRVGVMNVGLLYIIVGTYYLMNHHTINAYMYYTSAILCAIGYYILLKFFKK